MFLLSNTTFIVDIHVKHRASLSSCLFCLNMYNGVHAQLLNRFNLSCQSQKKTYLVSDHYTYEENKILYTVTCESNHTSLCMLANSTADYACNTVQMNNCTEYQE